MFVKKTGCDKYLMSLTVEELSALRVMSAWHRTVSEAVLTRISNRTPVPSDGDPTKIENTLCSIWNETSEFSNDIREARNAG